MSKRLKRLSDFRELTVSSSRIARTRNLLAQLGTSLSSWDEKISNFSSNQGIQSGIEGDFRKTYSKDHGNQSYCYEYRKRLSSAYRELLRSINKTFNKDLRNKSKVKDLTKSYINSKILIDLRTLSSVSSSTTAPTGLTVEYQSEDSTKNLTHKSSKNGDGRKSKKIEEMNKLLIEKKTKDVYDEEGIKKNLETELIGVLDLSKFFKKNLVQGEISNDRRTLSLRITEETELGDNNSIKKKKKEFPKK